MNGAQQQWYDPGFCDPAALPEFQVIAPALRRKTPLVSKVRTLQIVCDRQHLLAEVFFKGDRAVLLIREPWQAALLRELPERNPERDDIPFSAGELVFQMRCRCREKKATARWIKAQLAEGKKRIAVPALVPVLWA